MGLDITLAGAQLVGVDGLIFKASGNVLLNKATDANGLAVTRLNWFLATNATNDPNDLLPVFNAKLVSTVALSIEGSVDLDLFGLVLATGTFEMTQQDGVAINDGNGINLTNASLMTVSLSNLNLFVGVGASLNDNGSPDDLSDDFINTGSAIGFEVAGASLDMAIVKEDPLVGVRSWTGLSAHVNGMGIVGLPDSFRAERKGTEPAAEHPRGRHHQDELGRSRPGEHHPAGQPAQHH